MAAANPSRSLVRIACSSGVGVCACIWYRVVPYWYRLVPASRFSEVVMHTHVAIVGSGFAGLGTAIRLKQEGIDDFIVFERAADVGGVWRDNTYPGCACDVQSHLYSFSFAPNPNWTRSYSPQREIWQYLQDCARRFGILPHVRLEHAVTDARWDDHAQRWHLTTSRGEFTADVLVAGAG